MESSTKDIKDYKVDTNITLNENEKQIFSTLMQIVKEHNLKTTLRVAGGWVRDKVSFKKEFNSDQEFVRNLSCLQIMGKESIDIDIALDDMYGEEFAKLLNEKLHPDGQKKFGVIKSNSEKSKHLETATLRVHG